mmetsp:Transcript_36383/g.120501  ORF Transcript_36383/g.120501 Transcript_36383/m.120501 type:complete len:201 (-) Transcript_36383:792-1394(-)
MRRARASVSPCFASVSLSSTARASAQPSISSAPLRAPGPKRANFSLVSAASPRGSAVGSTSPTITRSDQICHATNGPTVSSRCKPSTPSASEALPAPAIAAERRRSPAAFAVASCRSMHSTRSLDCTWCSPVITPRPAAASALMKAPKSRISLGSGSRAVQGSGGGAGRPCTQAHLSRTPLRPNSVTPLAAIAKASVRAA